MCSIVLTAVCLCVYGGWKCSTKFNYGTLYFITIPVETTNVIFIKWQHSEKLLNSWKTSVLCTPIYILYYMPFKCSTKNVAQKCSIFNCDFMVVTINYTMIIGMVSIAYYFSLKTWMYFKHCAVMFYVGKWWFHFWKCSCFLSFPANVKELIVSYCELIMLISK